MIFFLLVLVSVVKMESPTLHELTEHGRRLELKGTELQKFILDQQAHYRELRAAERSKEKEEKEYQLKREELELERMKLAEAKGIAEAESKYKETLLKLEQQLQETKADMSSNASAKVPKMPFFEETKDDIDSYLRRFERYATAQKWNIETWAVNLSALLRGRALDVYSLLPQERALDYATLKAALLKGFERTEDGFRQHFRRCRPERGETFTQFSVRLGSYLDRWIELGKVNKTFQGLYDLVLRDQFLSICNKDLILFLKERIPNNIQDMCALADQYKEARCANIQTLVNSSRKDTSIDPQNSSQPKHEVQRDQKETAAKTKDQPPKPRMDVTCYKCRKPGHFSYQCSKGRTSVGMAVDGKESVGSSNQGKCAAFTTVTTTSSVSSANNFSILNTSCNASASVGSLPTSDGILNEHFVKVLRDTGCNGIVVRQALVPEEQLTGNKRLCILADGSQIEAPIARVSIDTPYFVGEVDAWCLKNPLFELIIGNIPKARDPSDPDRNWKLSQVYAVMTRQQAKREGKKDKPLHVPDIIGPELAFSPDDVIRAQGEDESLYKIRQLAEQPADESSKVRFFRKNGFFYRSFQSPIVENNKKISQLIVPKPLRNKVMSLAHDSLMTGHLGSSRTAYKVMSEFYWPGVQADVRRYCRSCDICQRTTPKGRTTKVPLGEMPLIDVPFQRVSVDLVGPIHPATDRGNRYILTLVGFATRYPEAVALKGIETEKVAEALIDIFCRIGVPKEMLTDQGTQFTSELMAETSRLLSFRQLTTTPYHPMCNGLVERFNGTLKQILRRLCAERPKDWDKYLSAALFAYRDATQESLGFSHFELVYGRTVRGPMRILRELWTKEVNDPEVRTTYQYIVDLKERIESTCTIAKENLEKATQRYRVNYNKRAKKRDMKVGEKVLVLLPTSSNKLLLQWRGPYEILEKVGNVDYKINMDGKTKTFHANMLKLYINRNNENDAGVLGIAGVAVVDLADDEDDGEDELCDSPGQERTEGAREVTVMNSLKKKRLKYEHYLTILKMFYQMFLV